MKIMSKKLFLIALLIYPLQISAISRNYQANIFAAIFFTPIEAAIPHLNSLKTANGDTLTEISYRYVPLGYLIVKDHKEKKTYVRKYIGNEKWVDRHYHLYTPTSTIFKIEPYFEYGYITSLKRNHYSYAILFFYATHYKNPGLTFSTFQFLVGGGYFALQSIAENGGFFETGIRFSNSGINFDAVYRNYLGHSFLKYSFNFRLAFWIF
jgi:hypothetical protein